MGVLVGRAACPVCRHPDKVEKKKEEKSYMTHLTECYLENFRAFLEAADLHLEKDNGK